MVVAEISEEELKGQKKNQADSPQHYFGPEAKSIDGIRVIMRMAFIDIRRGNSYDVSRE